MHKQCETYLKVLESIQGSFSWIENEMSFHFIVKTKTAIRTRKTFALDYQSIQNVKF